MTETEWKAFVEADCILSGIPCETEEDAREYIEKHVKTGHLGPIRIKGLQKDE